MAELEYKDMNNNTPKALRLARMIEHYNAGVESQRIVEDYQQSADELRRLYFENEKLCATRTEQPTEPVAWIDITDEGQIVSSPRMYSDGSREERPLYTAPQPAIPPGYKLVPEVPTNEWINNLARRHTGSFEKVQVAEIHQCIAELLESAPEAPQPAKQPLTNEQIDNTTRKQVDDLLDHIYEYGTATEGIDYRVRAIARAIERAHGIGEHE